MRTSNRRKVAGLLAVLISSTAAGCSTDTSQLAQGDTTTWKCEKETKTKKGYVFIPYDYVIQTAGDTIGVNGIDQSKSSVVLHTEDQEQKLPPSWTLDGNFTYEGTKDRGFTITGKTDNMIGGSIKQSLILNGSNGKMRVQNGTTITNLKCSRVGNWKTAINGTKRGPNAAYIEMRLSTIQFLRKKIGDPDFTSAVARQSNQNDDYQSVYSLLAPMPTSSLTRQETDLTESAKKKLIDEDTNSYDVWEWNNSWQGGEMFQSDEDKAARCNAKSGTTNNDGYKIVSSTPQDRIGGVNLTCHGTLHLLKKEGALPAEKHAELFSMVYD